MAPKNKTKYQRKNIKTKKKYAFFILIELLLIGALYLFKSVALRALILMAILFLPVFLSMYKKSGKSKSKKIENSKYNHPKVNFNENNEYYIEKKNYKLEKLDNKNINFIIDKDEEEQSRPLKDENDELREKVLSWVETVDYSASIFKRIIDNSKEEMEKDDKKCEDEKSSSLHGNFKKDKEVSFDKYEKELEEEYVEEYIEDEMPDDIEEEYIEDEMPDDIEEEYIEDEMPDDIEEEYIEDEMPDDIEEEYIEDEMPDDIEEEYIEDEMADDIEEEHIEDEIPDDIQSPPIELLEEPGYEKNSVLAKFNARKNAEKLINTLNSFGVKAKIINISEGPSVTRYELQPDYGVKVSKIVSLTDDIALNLAAPSVRIEAPIPGKSAIGIEIPNKKVMPVLLREVIESQDFLNHPSKLAFAVGKDIAGTSVIADIATMPHLLIAGATGSGKSVCINTLITSLIYKSTPKEVKFLMVDPKMVELGIYNGIPHLLIPVVTDPKKAAGALNWAVQEMTNRYKLFAENSVRDLKGYNNIMIKEGKETLPQIVIIIDELSDLMMVAPNDVEDCICRLAQMARAAGMHLVIATQRPSVNVITGVIKANIPSRISFAVSSQVDSRTILDMSGAEKLLGKGDMLFSPLGMSKPIRVQGALITDKEVESIVSFIKLKATAKYDEDILKEIESQAEPTRQDDSFDDELLPQVIDMVIEQGQASTSLIQRKFKLGYSRAARILDSMEAQGIVGPFEGSKPRKVLITKSQWKEREM
jgi:S-DNA-T family DNA segregation ATPase FtsK/SpoIIIE